jgi:Putative amidoligase enzyme
MEDLTTFGVELEVILPGSMNAWDAAQQVSQESGIEVRNETYNHATRTWWKVVHDGSLNGNGAEFVSPPLRGQAGLDEVQKVCDALNAIGARINKSCGLHVHLGIATETVPTIKNLIRIYAHYEPEIDRLMPGSRRGDMNTYCKSISRATDGAVTATTIQALRMAVNGYGDRYRKVNLCSFDKYRTIEFRHHSGTTDAAKVINWIKLLMAMLGAARKGKFPQGAKPTIIAKPGSKAAGVGALILRDGGATSDEINAFVGRPGVNVITIAAACGIAIRKERQGRITRYHAIGGATEATFDSLTAMIELPSDITAFYTYRRAALAAMTSDQQEIETNARDAR